MIRHKQRASVTVLAVAILALLFIIGSTLLFVSDRHREAAIKTTQARQQRAVEEAVLQATLAQLRLDVVGEDGIPYNSR